MALPKERKREKPKQLDGCSLSLRNSAQASTIGIIWSRDAAGSRCVTFDSVTFILLRYINSKISLNEFASNPDGEIGTH